jgi:hypothetical protein
MVPKLFNEDFAETYTDDAMSLTREVEDAVTAIAKKYEKLGYASRDIEYATMQGVFDAFLMFRLEKKCRKEVPNVRVQTSES